MKQAFRLQKAGALSMDKLLDSMAITGGDLGAFLKKMGTRGLVKIKGRTIELTQVGEDEARRLVRAHRLWETYLVDQLGLDEGQIHAEAEKYEHLLTDEILDEVDRELGFPTIDPHGSPIPSKAGSPKSSLWQVEIGQKVSIAQKQPNQLIAADLWKLGLLPGTKVQVNQKTQDTVSLDTSGNTIAIRKELAEKINTSN